MSKPFDAPGLTVRHDSFNQPAVGKAQTTYKSNPIAQKPKVQAIPTISKVPKNASFTPGLKPGNGQEQSPDPKSTLEAAGIKPLKPQSSAMESPASAVNLYGGNRVVKRKVVGLNGPPAPKTLSQAQQGRAIAARIKANQVSGAPAKSRGGPIDLDNV